MNCDKIAMEKYLLKEHLFINIINSEAMRPCADKETNGGMNFKRAENPAQNALPCRYYNLLRHAFIPNNRNSLFLLIDDEFHDNGEIKGYPCEINWMGIKSAACQDQFIQIGPGRPYERKMQMWFLSKLIGFEGNFPFYCLPILSRLLSLFSGIAQLKLNIQDHCNSTLTESYADLVMQKLADIETSPSSHTVPIFLHADHMVDWRTVKKCLLQKFSSDSVLFIGHYSARLNPICQDINFLLVSLLNYFKIFPKVNQLPFTTTQMATLVSSCLKGRAMDPEKKLLVLLIEDIDWITSSCLTDETCSWLPEKCASNIQVILTGAKESIHEKSLKCRLNPPKFIDVSYTEFHKRKEICPCQQPWCLSKLMCVTDTFQSICGTSGCDDVHRNILQLGSFMMSSVVCGLTGSQIEWLLSFKETSGGTDQENFTKEKDQTELSEKAIMDSSREKRRPLSEKGIRNISAAINILVDSEIIVKINLNTSDESCYALSVPQLVPHLFKFLRNRLDPRKIELDRCSLGAYLVYQATNLHLEMLFVPVTLQYLSGVKDTVLRDWLLNWPVFLRLRDEFCVPVRLLGLWRSLLGSSTDYKPMINAYISMSLPEKRDLGNCCYCKKVSLVELDHGPVYLGALRQSGADYSKAYSKHRYRVLLDLARISMQVGQYAVAKEIARSLLKHLDRTPYNRSNPASFDTNRNLLASCLHLLFCTLDERLKTFEFVTEQTTPIFRRTVHYGARALLLQSDIVSHIRKTIDNKDQQGLGDVRAGNVLKLQQQLCHAEIRLAHIMTHFVFSLDGVEQTVINRHFMPSEIINVTHACMSQAHEIATRLKDRQLLLEIQMTFGVIQPRENFREKILLYKTPLRQALCIYGEGHIFVSRLYINIGISYEEQKKYIKAFEYFTLWSHVTHELLGRNHCKSLRSCGVFKEPIFKVTADFLKSLNDEEPNESLEEELSDCINNMDVERLEDLQSVEMGIAGVGLGASATNSTDQNVSIENMFMMRNSMEHESDWEIHSSDDETPNYTTAFEEVIDTFKKKSSGATGKELLKSILTNSLVDFEDFSKEDIECLIRSQETAMDNISTPRVGSTDATANVTETYRINRMFRDLLDLAQLIPSTNLSPSDFSLSRRLLELQTELEEYLNN